MCIKTVNLNGAWTLQKNGGGKKIPASVPGDVYADLLAHGDIPDPFYRDNEDQTQWIGESDWSYSRTVNVSKETASKKHLILRCDGLDTFAKVSINGTQVSETDNMFRTYEWDVTEILKAGKNTIRIDFTSVLPYIQEKMKGYQRWQPFAHSAAYASWVRKEQCNFGWDWGIKAVTCGIWRDIQIIAYDESRLTDVSVQQNHSEGTVDLDVSVTTEGGGKQLTAVVTVLDGDDIVATTVGKILRKKTTASLSIPNPKLWWPNTMGEQPLYTINIDLKDADGNTIDTITKRVGLRTLELDRHDDQWGESFQFVVNGVPFFTKGANWIPVDAILARRTPDTYRRLIKDAADCNMNMLRVWGGGIYEDDCFYDICDELGICVWQDFMFACGVYPTFQKGFLANVRAEARDAIKRLRHHPCMAMWCGNNELEMMNVSDDGWKAGKMPWNAYKALFDDLLPKQIAELSPDIPYWPSSPHSPQGDRKKHRDHRSGDAHLWILCAKDPITGAQGSEHRFASEFGFQSFPEPKTVAGYAEADERNIASRIMEHHQRAPGGNTSIMQQILRMLPMPVGGDSVFWASQIMQGTGVKTACEHFRRSMPRTMGTLYWQLNDCWPVASWSSIDFHGRWKALQYMARHFFAPVMVSGRDDRERGVVEIHLTSDRLTAKAGTVSWTVTDAMGTILDEGSKRVKTPRNASRIVKTLHLKKLLKCNPHHDILVWLEAHVDGEPIQRNIVFMAPPKHIDLSTTPDIRYSVTRAEDGAFTVELKTKKVALWTWLELDGVDAVFSDNFFHLRPGISETVCVIPDRNLTVNQLKKMLIVRSLIDTCSAQ